MEDMLRWDPKKRPSAEKALRYPYFQVHFSSYNVVHVFGRFWDHFQGTVKQSASHILEQSLQRSHARKKSLPGVSAHIFILMINSQECIVMLPWAKNLKIASSSDLLGGGGRLWRGDCWLEGSVAKSVTGTLTIFFCWSCFQNKWLWTIFLFRLCFKILFLSLMPECQVSQAVGGLPQISHHRSHSRGPPPGIRSWYKNTNRRSYIKILHSKKRYCVLRPW